MEHLIICGSVFGNSSAVADYLATQLQQRAVTVIRATTATVVDDAQRCQMLWIVTSSTGNGDIPDSALGCFYQLSQQAPYLAAKQFMVIALGDSNYGDTYCGAGEQFQNLMLDLAARPLAEMLRIDAAEHSDAMTLAPALLAELLPLI